MESTIIYLGYQASQDNFVIKLCKTYDTVCAKAPARPPHSNLAGITSTTRPSWYGLAFPNTSGKYSNINDFNVSKP